MAEEGKDYSISFEGKAQMITADPDFELPKDMVKVDLACGQRKREGFLGMDRVKTEQTDIVQDLLSFPWPFEDNSVFEFYCSHFVEHIPIQLPDGSYGMNRFMEEVYRCLMPGGQIYIEAPYYTSIRAWQDPTHTRAITDVTFNYYAKKDYGQDKQIGGVDHYMPKCNFNIVHRRYITNESFLAVADDARIYASKHMMNVIDDIHFLLQKIDL